MSTETLEQDFKELNICLDDLCKQGHEVKDAGHSWIAFTDKFNAFKNKFLSTTTQKEISEEEIREIAIETYGNDPHLYGGQRDGFVAGFKAALNLTPPPPVPKQ